MDKASARFVIGLLPILLCVVLWAVIVVFLRIKKKTNLVHLAFFTIFCIYIYKVLDYTLFQFQSLLLMQHFVPDLILSGLAPEERVNLVPLVTLTHSDLRTSILNVLLMIPFGFGLPFIMNVRVPQIIWIGGLFSIFIELLQLTTGLLGRTSFRVADINDVVFNTVGVAVGYTLFVGFAHSFPRILLEVTDADP